VFTRTKFGANNVAEYLSKNGITAMALHGNKGQGARTQALSGFKSGDIRALVATDIAARGIDIDDLPHVVNYEIPNVCEDYVHRIGRTGRAGASGLAVSLVTGADARLMGDIEKLIKKKPDVETFELERRQRSDRGERDSYRRESRDLGGVEERGERAERPARVAAPRRSQPADPFFDKPYEADPNAEPTWEKNESAATNTPTSTGAGLSRFIKPKRKVATLLGGSGTARR